MNMSNLLRFSQQQVQKVFKTKAIFSTDGSADQLQETTPSFPPSLNHHDRIPRTAQTLSSRASHESTAQFTSTHSGRPDSHRSRKHSRDQAEDEAPTAKLRRITPTRSRGTSQNISARGFSPASSDELQAAARPSFTRDTSTPIELTKRAAARPSLTRDTSTQFELTTRTRTESHPPSTYHTHRNEPVEYQTKHYESSTTRQNPFSRCRPGRTSRPAYHAPVTTRAERRIREIVRQRVAKIPGPEVKLVNDQDDSTLPLSFYFNDEYAIREGILKDRKGFMTGCKCRVENGRHVGCEYTSCECLEFANVRENGRKEFPYYCTGPKTGCLRQGYLETRDAIFECNERCRCAANCKNRIVQKGRVIRLEIFKTAKRGWGLRSPETIRAGQFVDTYKGEIITSKEADLREAIVKSTKDSYLYVLDKFVGEENNLKPEEAYIVDGEYLGTPTRFMNHSCEPNCRQFTVSYNHSDNMVYDLAFFAIREIPAGTELTFDYLDKDAEDDEDDEDDDEVKATDRKGDKGEVKPTECLCGAKNCRKWLWM